NEQMRPAEVLAVEVAQYVGVEGRRTLVPKLVGATERARSNKSVPGKAERMTLQEWLFRLSSRHGIDTLAGAEKIIAWFQGKGLDVAPTVSGDALAVAVPTTDARRAWPFFIRQTGNFE